MQREIRRPSPEQVRHDVTTALEEDIGSGDVTARLIDSARQLQTRVICREQAILCGRPWFDETFAQLDERIVIDWSLADGDEMSPGQIVCSLVGPARPILTGERTALNFLQALSACASKSRAYCQAVAGTKATILDTRKTIPGLRRAQKYAVRCGGASNHRVGLFDAFLIKENHIAAAGSISEAVHKAANLRPDLMLEVEVETLEQLDEAVASGARRALLDNFSLEKLREAVQRHGGRIELEASGGVNLESVRDIAQTGVDFISTGELTKHVRAVDFSMRFR
ncbi:MAG: carboxylating nicotinate-nucleotide diphosphorylase [Xanthomonadales bacterium]|nr:carboxylating nicotinate-nucleotide diphosphorylase [Gammaproteobacteria bacterium]NNE04311.1 carboxylating nicotinate-nucleotide diphosphorylase [Xanthomonadales bacterium]NNL95924.1 carboxylating nicotinate-nucleotide diphosphorylase [Xanthomonadales bacterium]